MISVDRDLSRRLERHLAAGSAAHARAVVRLWPDSGACVAGAAVYAGPGSPVSGAAGIGFGEPVDLDALEAFFRARGLPPRLTLSPLADASLFAALGRRGYCVVQCKNLHVLSLAAAPAAAAGLAVEPVPPEEGALWAATVSSGFGAAETHLATANYHADGVTSFLARVDGQPAAASPWWRRCRAATRSATCCGRATPPTPG